MNERGKRWLFQAVFVYLPLAVVVYIVVLFGLIRRSAGRDDAQTADMIIVFGAAQYNGRPSPVFKARLDHTASLFRRNLSKRIMTTGGHGIDKVFTEAEVGKQYLIKQSIPEDCIFLEQSSLTTLESIERVLSFMRMQHFTKVIAVSDGFHLFRIKQIFRDHNVLVYGSPAVNSPIESNSRLSFWASLREVFVYTAYLAQRKLHLPVPSEALSSKE